MRMGKINCGTTKSRQLHFDYYIGSASRVKLVRHLYLNPSNLQGNINDQAVDDSNSSLAKSRRYCDKVPAISRGFFHVS